MMGIIIDSIVLLSGAWLAARLCQSVKIPTMLGMICAGILFTMFPLSVGADELRLTTFSKEIRLGILALILLRAGLGISLQDAKNAGGLAVRLGTIPMLGETIAVGTASFFLLDLNIYAASVLGFLIAAISPAIVIPGLIDLIDKHKDARSQRCLNALLVGAPLDNILALLGLSVALEVALSDNPSLGMLVAQVPIALIGGALCGWLTGRVFQATGLSRSRIGGPLILWGAAIGNIVICQALDLSIVVAIVVLGLTVRHYEPASAETFREPLTQAWNIAKYLLFSLIGAAVDLGPLADVGLLLVLVIVAGQSIRMVGSAIATANADLSPTERLACAMSYIPKATIQAAFAALPLDRGLEAGPLILSAGVLAIILTVPPGIISIERVVDKLLTQANGPKTNGSPHQP